MSDKESKGLSSVYKWDETGDAKIYPRSKYNLFIGLTLVWGFLVDFIICGILYNHVPQLMTNEVTFFGTLIVGFILMIAGIFINVKSRKPIISFIGYNIVVIPMGIILTVFVYQYQVVSVVMCYLATLIVSAIMTVAATLKPDFFRGLGKGLFIALIAAIVVELVLTFVVGAHLSIFDWVVAIIFCGYIGYDWVKAQDHPATLDNAIDSACSLYLDIVNLFIRLLEIFGKK